MRAGARIYGPRDIGVTRRLELDEMQRPRRVLGEALRDVLSCPLCLAQELRVVAYRRRTCRLECRACELRLSLSPFAVGQALEAHAEAVAERMPSDRAARHGVRAICELGDSVLDGGDFVERCVSLLRSDGRAIAWASCVRPPAV